MQAPGPVGMRCHLQQQERAPGSCWEPLHVLTLVPPAVAMGLA